MGTGLSGVTSFIAESPGNEERIVESCLSAWTATMKSTVEGIRGLAEGRPDPPLTIDLQPTTSSGVSHRPAGVAMLPPRPNRRHRPRPPCAGTTCRPRSAPPARPRPVPWPPRRPPRGWPGRWWPTRVPVRPAARRDCLRRRCATIAAGRGRYASPGLTAMAPARSTVRSGPQ
jgi:hypothetical protein